LSTPPRPDAAAARRRTPADLGLIAVIALLSVGAWYALWSMDQASSGSAGHHHHHHEAMALTTGPLATLLAGGLFVGGWVVMTIAMMLPSSLPLLAIFRRLVRERGDRAPLVGLLVGGYLAAWAVFGALAFGATLLLRWLAEAVPAVAPAAEWAPAALFVLAGAFQFSALKYRCLDLCRSPLSFVTSHWHGSNARKEALRLGWDHGVFCVGCCWALMLLMFAFSAAHLLWMLVLGALMAIEKNARWGRRMSAPVGVALIATGLALVAYRLS
jgi:predicted metal-binding membrane protein